MHIQHNINIYWLWPPWSEVSDWSAGGNAGLWLADKEWGPAWYLHDNWDGTSGLWVMVMNNPSQQSYPSSTFIIMNNDTIDTNLDTTTNVSFSLCQPLSTLITISLSRPSACQTATHHLMLHQNTNLENSHLILREQSHLTSNHGWYLTWKHAERIDLMRLDLKEHYRLQDDNSCLCLIVFCWSVKCQVCCSINL